MEGYHKSVLLREVLEGLRVEKGEWYLDCTLGDGGHSLEIIRRGGKVLGLDVDPDALERVKDRFKSGGIGFDQYNLVRGNFRSLKNLTQTANLDQFKGVLFDLGVSSLQLQTPQRGFSFSKAGPLDMRMDPTLEVAALDLVNALGKGELYELFSKYGGEYSRRFVEAVVSARKIKRIESTTELAEILEKVAGKRGKIHPATKVFQALRIAVNDELNAITEALPQALEVTKRNGCILVISFHSLEDRIVKTVFRDWESAGFGQIVTKKPIIPSIEETRDNPRARSAKLRIFKK